MMVPHQNSYLKPYLISDQSRLGLRDWGNVKSGLKYGFGLSKVADRENRTLVNMVNAMILSIEHPFNL